MSDELKILQVKNILERGFYPSTAEEFEKFEQVISIFPDERVKPIAIDFPYDPNFAHHGFTRLETVLKKLQEKINLNAFNRLILSVDFENKSQKYLLNEMLECLNKGLCDTGSTGIVDKCKIIEIVCYAPNLDLLSIKEVFMLVLGMFQATKMPKAITEGKTKIINFKMDQKYEKELREELEENDRLLMKELFVALIKELNEKAGDKIIVLYDGKDVLGQETNERGETIVEEHKKSEDDGMTDSDFSSDSMAENGNTTPVFGRRYWELEDIPDVPTGKGVTIAVVDTGIDPYHPAIYKKIKNGNFVFKDFSGQMMNPKAGCIKTEDYHGTKCAVIACGTNRTPVKNEGAFSSCQMSSGIAPDAKLIVCKVTGGETIKIYQTTAEALRWIKEQPDIDVVSISVGGNCRRDERDEAVKELVKSGKIVVCAASNYGRKQRESICYPAKLEHTLCIGSHDRFGNRSRLSPVGQRLDFLGPGENVVVPVSATEVACASGTSYAAPAIAGLICLLLQAVKDKCSEDDYKKLKDHIEIKELLKKLSVESEHFKEQGYGAIDLQRLAKFFKNPADKMFM